MEVLATQVVDVHRDPRGLRVAAHELAEHADVELVDAAAQRAHLPDHVGTVAEVEHAANQRLVERRMSAAEAANAGAVAERLAEGGAEHQPAVLDEVMAV